MREIYCTILHAYLGSSARRILIESLGLLAQLWTYVVIGIVLTTFIKLYVPKKSMADFFALHKNISIILAALIGVVSPLGSYVVIPLSAALFAIGVPLPSLMALMMSSPLIDPNLLVLTAGTLGMELALVRTLSALVLGISAGYITWLLIRKKYLQVENILQEKSKWGLGRFRESSGKSKWGVFWMELYKMANYVGKYFIIAVLLAAVIKIMVPAHYIARYLGQDTFLSVLLTTGAGIPFYICGGAAIPVLQQLAELGMGKGAVLAFFISGPATKISSLVLIHSAISPKVFFTYLLIGISGAFALICEKTTHPTLFGNRADGLKFYTDAGDIPSTVTKMYKMDGEIQVFPNPCSEYVNIRFSFLASVKASVDIYDINGKFVSHIGEGYYGAGWGKLSWNLTGNKGNKISPGVYLCTIRSGGIQANRNVYYKIEV